MMRGAWAGTFATLLAVSTALAQSPDVTKADALFKQGRAAMKAGDYDSACPKLEESYNFDPAPGTAVNLGDCFEKQGKVGSALLAYQAARKLLSPGDPRIGPVQKQIAALEKRTPKLTITLAPDAPEGTKVTRDGKAVDFSEFGSPLLVNPGEVNVVVIAPRRESRNYFVDLSEGESRVLVVDAGTPGRGAGTSASAGSAKPGLSKPAREEVPSDGSTQRTLGYLGGGAGAVGVVVGIVAWTSAAKNASDADKACPSTPCPQATRYNDLRADESSNRNLANVAFGVGGIALAGGIALVLLAPERGTASSRLHAAPTVTHASYGLNVGGTW